MATIMMPRIFRKIFASAKLTLVLVTLVSLFVFGNSMIAVTATVASPENPENSTQNPPTQCRLVAGFSLPNVDDGSMNKGDTPNSEHCLYFTVPAIAGTYSIGDNRPETPVIETRMAPRPVLKKTFCATTTASISAHKAREFTLVGAKPSGTS